MIRPRLRRTLHRPRLLLLVPAGIVAALAVVGAVTPGGAAPAERPTLALADRLEPRTWAVAIPLAWLSAPLTDLREGDVLDLIATRTSERASAREVASGLRVMSLDEHSLVVELTSDDAASIAEARARGLSFVPILRSSR